MQKITRIAAIFLVVLAFFLALLALSLGRRNAQQHTTAPPQAVRTAPISTSPNNNGAPVVVAAEALPAGQAIPFSSLRVINDAQPPQGSFVDIDAVAGHLPLVGIPAGTPITADLLAHGMAMQLMPGERALAVPVDEVAGVGNHIVPGDLVDVFLSLKNPPNTNPGANRDLSQTRLLLSRLRVLAYGDRDLPVPAASVGKPAAPAATSSAVKSDVAEQARTAVLAVPVAEVDELLLATQNGKLTLALRYPGDENQPDGRLFPQPPVVLAPLAYLAGEQHEPLDSPENDAFAGIDGSGLAGQIVAARRTTHRHVELASGVEIIRGAQRSDGTGTHSP
jgi:pilus assembly protein CpaB